MVDESGVLDLATIESDKAIWYKFMNFDFPEQTITGFGVVPNGIKKQLWIKMEDSQEQKVLIQANPFSDAGITIVGYEYPQFLTLSGAASRDYVLELSSLGEGKWIITNASSLIGQEVTIGNFILNGIVPLRFVTNEVYTMALMEADATLILDPEFPDQVPGARKTMVIEANGYNLTFGTGTIVLSGIWDNRAGNSNFIEMIFTEFDGALITITSQAISPTTAIKGSTADQLSLLPIELTSAEFFELKNNSGLVPKQFYLINNFTNENNVLEGLFVFAMSENTFSFETTSKSYPDKKVWLKTSDLFEFTRTYQEPQGILSFAYTSKNVLTLYNAMRTNFERRREGDWNALVIYAISNGNEITLTTENKGTEWSYDISTHQITLLGDLASSSFSFLDIDLVPDSSIYFCFDYYTVSKRHGALSDAEIAKIHSQNTDTKLAEGTANEVSAADIRTNLDTKAIPASAFTALSTNGATYQEDESTTNKVINPVFKFSGSTLQTIQYDFVNDGTIKTNKLKFKVLCKRYAATTNFGVVWNVCGSIINSDTVIDTAFGTAVTKAITLTNDTDEYLTTQSTDVTLGGDAIATDSHIYIQISRLVSDGGDSMDGFAGLMHVKLLFNQ
jgi:hypothetical protein